MYIQCVNDDNDDGWFLTCKDQRKETGNMQYVNKLIRMVQIAVDVILRFL